jgi:hypothetical protein
MTRVSTVIQSHLNNILFELNDNTAQSYERLSFIKQLLSEYPDTTVRISDDELADIWYYATSPSEIGR